jgi:Fe-S-cluster containining protein
MCNAECCRYITVDLATPEDKEDWDEIKWLLMHEKVMIYKDLEGDWMIEIQVPCKHLKGNLCDIYEKRPNVCREHETSECEKNIGAFAKVMFKKPEDVDRYLAKKGKP